MANTYPRIDLTRGTGPQGHRARMRARVLANGAHTLADYEILEMLLFAGVPRKDTKPLAKGLIAHFGSLVDVFRAPTHALRAAGLKDDAIRVLRLPGVAAERLASSEQRERPTLSNWEQLMAYLEQALEGGIPGQFRLLYLDNRNRLLADEAAPEANSLTERNRAIAIRALALHATALIGFHITPTQRPADLSQSARQLDFAMRPLSITLHDVLVTGEGRPSSLRQEGLL
ncbi:MAG: RadC family protein [Gluconobacter potus]|uniref:RadC family protein n=1 Tax=Gluconobacter potus TaxID=2724927 RepID=A0ABR9YLL4_9PROT|nr:MULTISPECIES: RadC family protein [Gluconobacter]MBF0864605.1 RadC family protein [Gluconobacter sp. R71656]MBF0867001.1 RadC family protein [Gluconobacter sp. R75628]MBF0873431.1 RadC family protein [Gluconobacter sp. R75629]MBF0882677.1 RadC family protein [Gluconobacter potus]